MFVVETYLDKSEGKGIGVFSKNFIKKGELIWEFKPGLDIKIHVNDLPNLNGVHTETIDKYFWKEGDYLFSSCDLSIFQNHSDNPNSVVFTENQMIASRDINEGEEILCNYKEFDDLFDTYKDILSSE